jgi:phage terminase small subunit
VAPPEPPYWLDADERAEWDRQHPRWVALGHLTRIDSALLGVLVVNIVRRRRLLAQIERDKIESQSVALELLREMTDDIAVWERELGLD